LNMDVVYPLFYLSLALLVVNLKKGEWCYKEGKLEF
jgi:hypothetical protein